MNKNNLKIFFLFTICLLILDQTANAFTFNQDLNLGSSGQDVYELQKFLNTYSTETVISNSGIGSLGNETTYFGLLTKLAVQKFQNLNYENVLKPVNLSAGTGYLGKTTRNFINAYLNSTTNKKIPHDPIKTPGSSYSGFLLLSQSTVRNGDEISLANQASTPISKLDFYIENQKLKKKCPTEYVCSVKIETKETGKRYLTTNDNNISPEVITIVDQNSQKPSVSISKLKLNTETTIKGTNLSSTIKVYTLFDVYTVKTQNNSFKINIKDPQKEIKEDLTGPFYVKNENGLTSDIMIITYEI